MEDVISAIRVLHCATTVQEKRREADAWLRRWQESGVAWEASNEMLLKSNDPEANVFAAITIRFKITYDFHDLPPENHWKLLESVLNHLQRFAATAERQTMLMLCLSVAILSVQMSQTWKDPVETMMQRFSTTRDLESVFLEFIRILPEEGAVREILTNPSNQHEHSKMLSRSASKVLNWLDTRFQQVIPEDKSSINAILMCFVEWLGWVRTEAELTLLSNMTRRCFELLCSDQAQTLEYAADSLIEILRTCRKKCFSNSQVLCFSVNQLAGPVAALTRKKLQQENWEDVCNIAKLYQTAGRVLSMPIAFFGKSNTELRNILNVLCTLTLIPYIPEDPDRGDGGITENIMGFWWKFLEVGGIVRSHYSHSKEGRFVEEAMQFITETIYTSFPMLLATCEIPQRYWVNSCGVELDSYPEFEFYRSDNALLVADIHEILGLKTILNKIMYILSEPSSTMQLLARREACLYCLSKVIVTTTAGQVIDIQKHADLLLPLLKSVPQLLPKDPPSHYLDFVTRTSTLDVITELAKTGLISLHPETIGPLLTSVALQLFFQSNFPVTKDFPHLPIDDPSTEGQKSSSAGGLQLIAALTFRSLCEHTAATQQFQQICKELIVGIYSKFQGVREAPFVLLLEGIASTFKYLKHDQEFLFGVEQLCNPIISSIRETNLSGSQLCTQLGRLAAIIKYTKVTQPGIGPTGQEELVESATRKQCMSQFITLTLWPMMKHIITTQLEDSNVIERSGRILKHCMRCIKSEFRSIMDDLTSVILDSAQRKFHSTFLYAAEWLITEFYEDTALLPKFSEFFQCLTAIGYENLSKALQYKSPRHLQYVIEDFYGIFCRYQRFTPIIPATSVTLTLAFNVLYTCMHVNDRDTLNVVFGFLENIISMLGIVEEGEKSTPGGQDISFLKEAIDKNVRPLVLQNLPHIANELVSIISTQPTEPMFRHCVGVLICLKENVSRENIHSSVDASLKNLSYKIIPNEETRVRLLKQICGTDQETEEAVIEIAHRCRQLKNRSTQVSAD